MTLVGALAAALASGASVEARSHHRSASEAFAAAGRSVPLASLPAEAQTTYRVILVGGPFPYPKDGTVFSNREGSLPREPRGFYHEYTVRTPGAHDRGARRIICGGFRSGDQPRRAPADSKGCYYTGDHYATFAQILN